MTRPRRLPAALAGVLAAAAVLVAVPATTASATVSACSTEDLTLTPLHGPNFYIDSGETPALYGAYAGYAIANTGSARSNLWVRLTTFTGGSVALGTGQPAAQQISALPGSSDEPLFWYLSASAASSSAQGHTVEVWQGRPDLPGATQLCADSGGFAGVVESIKAAANKLTDVSVDGGTPTIGSTFTITVEGETGTIGAGPAGDAQSFWMSPAATSTWPADAFRLVGTSLELGSTTYPDTLRVSGVGGANRAYTATYTFRAVGPTTGSTQVVPVQQIASGTQIKHTDIDSAGTLPAVAPATSDLTLAKTADVASLPSGGGQVHYEVTVSGTAGASLDDFADTVPVGATYVPGSGTWAGATISDGVLSGGVLTFTGPFTVAASNNVLGYDLILPATPGDAVNSVAAHVGSATIDASVALADTTAAAVTVHVNAPPVAVDDTASVTDSVATQVAVLDNDSDPENDTLGIDSVSTPANGTATITGSTITYTSNSGYAGSDQFTYTVSDGNGGSDTATVDVTVSAPVTLSAVDDAGTATSGGAEDYDVLDNDTGNDPMTVTAVGTATHGTVTILGGGAGVRYTPSGSHHGSDTFTYTVTDALGGTDTATVTVTVSPPALVAGDDTASTDDATPVEIEVLDNDSGFGDLEITATTSPSSGTVVDNGDGTITFTPASGVTGQVTFDYTVTDDAGQVTTATVTVTVTPAGGGGGGGGGAPAAVDDTGTAAPGGSTTVDVLDNDTGSGLSVTALSGPGSGGTAQIVSGGIQVTPASGFRGTLVVTYTVIDADGGTDTATLTVTVPNAAPSLASPSPRAFISGGSATSLLAVADPDDDDSPTVSAGTPTGSPNASTQVGVTIGTSGGQPTVRVQAAIAFSGLVTIPLTVADGHGGTAVTSLQVTVSPRPPVGVRAGVVANPIAHERVSTPRYDRNGRPIAQLLTKRIDSTVSWTASPTTSVTGYEVRVNGVLVCRTGAGRRSCSLTGRAITPGDAVTVTALGAASTESTPAPVHVTPAAGGRHLLAVVYFPSGEFSLDAEARTVLRAVNAMAVKYDLDAVRMVGHTDSRAGVAYNKRLSAKRAAQVGQWMKARGFQVSTSSTGYGELRPAVSNGTSRGRAANRRVEIYIG